MQISFIFVLLGSTTCSTLAAPGINRIPISKRAGLVKANSYVVKLKDGVSKSAHLAGLRSIANDFKVAYTYDEAFQGYSVQLEGKSLDYVQQSRDVEYIVEDGLVKLSDVMTSGIQPAPRGQGAVFEERAPLNKRVNGTGVDIYQIDTGIYTAHNQFGGRAKWGATFGGYPNADGNGHGTALASIIVGSTYGVANRANITAIKTFGDDGSAYVSDIIEGINWVITTSASSGRPSIAILTVVISGYAPLDNAVNNAISKGIHFVVAAGDSNVDAGTISPARVPAAVTVGAITTSGSKLSTSNFGSVVDVWGPGANVRVAWISSPTAAVNLVGTTASAASNVAGVLAVAIDNHGNQTPAALEADLKTHAKTINGFLVPQVW